MIYGKPITIGGSGLKAQILASGDVLSTDTVVATKGSKTVNGVWDSTNEYFLLDNLDEGTWSVTATRGSKSKSYSVVIDTIGQYEIDISYALYLIQDSAICDGYSFVGVVNTSASTSSYYGGGGRASSTSYRVRTASVATTVTLQCVKSSSVADGSDCRPCAYCTTLIDLSLYSTLHVNFRYTSTVTSSNTKKLEVGTYIDTACNSTRAYANPNLYTILSYTSSSIPTGTYSGTVNYTRDISSFSDEYLIILYLYSWGNAVSTDTITITDIWLE